jgi:hypothetical protein
MIKMEVVRRVILANDEDFNIEKIYKSIKGKADSLGYDFFEKEQANKSGKYGDEIEFKFLLVKKVDPFGMIEINTDFKFMKLDKNKEIYHGNAMCLIVGTVKLDYEEDWSRSSFKRFLLNIYKRVNENNLKRKYIVPAIIESTEIQNYIKDKFGFE